MSSFSLPDQLSAAIETLVERRPAKEISHAVKTLSDLYQSSESQTPWEEKDADLAYLSYFLPLNYLRLKTVIQEAKELGFFDSISDNNSYIDFGSGPGTASLVIEELLPQFSSGTCIEPHLQGEEVFKKITSRVSFSHETNWFKELKRIDEDKYSLGVFSYSLNELETPPKWMTSIDHLIILEPSTNQAGRKLHELRQSLLNEGYSIWAPCTHQLRCPLMLHSKKDWCHHRINTELPDWYMKIEEHLPTKNRNITFSYLLASRTERPVFVDEGDEFRLVGDMMKEKGKTKVMACRGEQREFLSWLHKKGEVPDLRRGQRLQIEELESKGNELRPLQQHVKIL